MFPNCGLLNLNAQPSVHVIHQRLEEIKNAQAICLSSSSSSTSGDPKSGVPVTWGGPSNANCEGEEREVEFSSRNVLGGCEEKPQIDLNEFLQQLGVMKKDDDPIIDTSEVSSGLTEIESSLKDDDNGLAVFAEKNFDWDTLSEIHGIENHQVEEINSFHVYDIHEELGFPTSIWNF